MFSDENIKISNLTKSILLCKSETVLGFQWESNFNSSFVIELLEIGEENWKYVETVSIFIIFNFGIFFKTKKFSHESESKLEKLNEIS